jgi:fibronectin type 3 domain-containing protein
MRARRRRALVGLLVLAVGLASARKAPHSVTLTWQTAKAGPGVSVVGYNVYRRTKTKSGFIKIATRVPGPPYEDQKVVSGKTYLYAVTAVDQLGRESRLSENIQATIP